MIQIEQAHQVDFEDFFFGEYRVYNTPSIYQLDDDDEKKKSGAMCIQTIHAEGIRVIPRARNPLIWIYNIIHLKDFFYCQKLTVYEQKKRFH